jgi:methionyl-tRNA synthetase
MKKNIFIGVAWPYVNGDLHVGHVAGYLLPADITARFFRLRGNNVLMASGSDCFGTPITVEADKRKVNPGDIVDEYHERNLKLFENLGLTFDIYTKTTTDNHKKITQEFLLKFWEKGLLEVDSQKQYYSQTLDRFLPDRYVEGVCPHCGFEGARSDQCDNCGRLLDQDLKNPISKIDKFPVILKDTKHLFIKWDKLQDQIKEYVDKSSPNWRDWVKGETYKWLNMGLAKRAVTRDLDWGVEIPGEIAKDLEGFENKRIYVWFDAVIGYYSASIEWDAEKYKDYWNNSESSHYYFMGKDNLVFHTIFWPGQLMVFDESLHLPDFPMINQYLTLGGQKFSKSRGVVVDTADFVEKYGSDALRFYLATIMPENSDSSFTWEDFYKKNNDLLVGHIGNYIHRTLSLFNGHDINGEISADVTDKIKLALSNSVKYLEKSQFKNYLDEISKLAEFANGYFNQLKPWENKNGSADLIILTYAIASLIEPITPNASGKYFAMVGLGNNDLWRSEDLEGHLSSVVNLIKINNPSPLFTKFDQSN